MRPVVLGLVTAFALLQFVTYTACACDSLCGHKNACERNEGDDCCKHKAPAPEAPCFHLEPQSDVDVSVAAPDFPILAIPFDELTASLELSTEASRVHPIGLSPPFRELPLYLEHLALRI